MRINLYGGPCSGKSTTAAWVFSELKRLGYSVEHCSEYVKAWAYQNRKVNVFDQVYLFGKQQQYEYRFISYGVKNVVTDSPCLLSSAYSKYYGNANLAEGIEMLYREYEAVHPSFNIILDRGDKKYVQEGRWQNEDQARELDVAIETTVRGMIPADRIVKIDFRFKKSILDIVEKWLDK